MPVCILSPPGYDWVTLSPCYVKTDGDVAGWRELFSRLGVRDGLIIRKERRTLTAQELVRLSVVLPQLFRDHTKKLLWTPTGLYKVSIFTGCVDTTGTEQASRNTLLYKQS